MLKFGKIFPPVPLILVLCLTAIACCVVVGANVLDYENKRAQMDHDLQEYAEIFAKLPAMKREAEQLTMDIQQGTTELISLREHLAKLQQEKQVVATVIEQKESAERQLNTALTAKKQTEEQREKAHDECASLNAEVQKLMAEKQGLTQESERLQQQQKGMRETLQKTQSELTSLQAEVDVQKKLKELLQRERTELQAFSRDITQQIEAFHTATQQMTTAGKSAQSMTTDLSGTLDNIKKDAQTVAQLRKDFTVECDTAQQESRKHLQDGSAALNALLTSLRDTQRQIAEASRQTTSCGVTLAEVGKNVASSAQQLSSSSDSVRKQVSPLTDAVIGIKQDAQTIGQIRQDFAASRDNMQQDMRKQLQDGGKALETLLATLRDSQKQINDAAQQTATGGTVLAINLQRLMEQQTNFDNTGAAFATFVTALQETLATMQTESTLLHEMVAESKEINFAQLSAQIETLLRALQQVTPPQGEQTPVDTTQPESK